jgi:hypothetical protein
MGHRRINLASFSHVRVEILGVSIEDFLEFGICNNYIEMAVMINAALAQC